VQAAILRRAPTRCGHCRQERDGIGLGQPLAKVMAKAMAECHGAAFQIISTLGIGTRIWG